METTHLSPIVRPTSGPWAKTTALGFLLACALTATAQTKPHTPAQGSKERKALMDALRVPVQKSLKGKKVVFKVEHLKVLGTWAFLYGVPVKPDGSPMDYRGTTYQEAIDSDAFDSNVCGLFRKVKGKWIVKDWRLGMTDVGWDGWWQQYRAPRSIFPVY